MRIFLIYYVCDNCFFSRKIKSNKPPFKRAKTRLKTRQTGPTKLLAKMQIITDESNAPTYKKHKITDRLKLFFMQFTISVITAKSTASESKKRRA